MTIMEFWSLRRAARRARKADRAMRSAFGHSWGVHRDAIYDLLTSAAPLYVVDAGALDRAARRIVADELASGSSSTEVEGFGETFSDEALAVNTAAVARLLPEAESAAETFDEPVESLDIAQEQSNGVAAVARPDLHDDDKRRAFVRSFLQAQRAARGPVTSNQPMRS